MLDLNEINKTISELENGDTTFRACEKLCHLYTVRDHLTPAKQDEIVEEYNDILPSYNKYCEAKKQYQLNYVPKEYMLQSATNMWKEIQEFLCTLYHNTDTEAERKEFKDMLDNILSNIK